MRISDWSSDVCSSDLLYVLSVGCSNRQTFSHLSPCHDTLTLMIHSLDGNCAISTAWIIPPAGRREIGRASCRERVCQYVSISVVAVSLKKKRRHKKNK